MSDVVAGPKSGVQQLGIGARPGGSPPPVLLGALGAASIISLIVLVLLATGGGGDGGSPVPAAGAAAAAPLAETDGRVLLTVSFEGDGRGRVEIAPRGDTCTERCEQSFASGTRVSVTAQPAGRSTFEGWGDACDGDGRCSFVMDRERALTVTFERRRDKAPAPLCDAGGDVDPACADGAGDPDDRPIGRSDCLDGKDNDGDGLTDASQDPGCDADDTEAETRAPPAPPPPAIVNDCADGKDNDRDGLTDSAQDPDCTGGKTESGSAATSGGSAPAPAAPAPAAPAPAAPAASECADGEDNDRDGLVDTAQDPGCESDRTEAGAP